MGIAPTDRTDSHVASFLGTQGAVEVEKLQLHALAEPLVGQHGRLGRLGVLNVGARLREQDSSADDRSLLNARAILPASAQQGHRV
jgi:hypothetical protein